MTPRSTVRLGTTLALIALGIAGACTVSSSAVASTTTTLVGISPNDSGSIGFIDAVSGLDVAPEIPDVAFFPSTPSDGLSNTSGLAFNPVDGKLYAMDYACELIQIDLVTGVSTPYATAPSTPTPGSECEGLAINKAGKFFAGNGAGSPNPEALVYFDTDEWYTISPNTFLQINWMAYNPTNDTLVFNDTDGSTSTVKSVSAEDGSSNLTTLGADTHFLSSASIDPAGQVYAGYWGDYLYSGPASTFPAGMTEAPGVSLQSYWVAAVPQSDNGGGGGDLPNTGASASQVGIIGGGAALLLLGGLVLATIRRFSARR